MDQKSKMEIKTTFLAGLVLFRAEIFRNAKTQIVRDFSYLREFPSLWFGDVRIADVLLLELSNLELAVWFPLLAHVQNGGNY